MTRHTCLLALLGLELFVGACNGNVGGTMPMDGGMDAGPMDAAVDASLEMDAMPDGAMAPSIRYGVCSEDDWCWLRPTPHGHDVRGIWSDGSEAWAVGTNGSLAHFDGNGWLGAESPVDARLTAIWGTAAEHLWAVGDDGVILRYDGEAWRLVEPALGAEDAGTEAAFGHLFGAWGADGKLWIVGELGVILHFDGEAWTRVDNGSHPTLRSVWGTTHDDIWAVGDNGTALHWNGQAWTQTDTPTGRPLYSVHGLAAHDVWAVGDNGTALHWDGEQWSEASEGLTGALRSVRVDMPLPPPPEQDAGTPMVQHDAGTPDAGMPGSGPWLAWATGEDGALWRWNGNQWWPASSSTMRDLRALWRSGSADIWVAGALGFVQRWQPNTRTDLSSGSAKNHLALWGRDEDDVWSVGNETLHRDEEGWQVVDAASDRSLFGLWGDDEYLWAVGTDGTFLRHDGEQWADVAPDAVRGRWLRGIWGIGNSAWVVGEAGSTLVRAATTWVEVDHGYSADLLDVWGSAEDDFWAVGNAGIALHWNGSDWADVPTGPDGNVPANLRGIWGFAADDVWTVGTGGTILHWDGDAWSIRADGEGYSLNDVWGRAPDEMWAVGTGGTILRWDGDTWTAQESGVTVSLEAVWGTHDSVWAAGLDGVLVELRGSD